MTDHQSPNFEWEAIRRNWPIIMTFMIGVGFAIEQWDQSQDMQDRLTKVEEIVSLESVIEYTLTIHDLKRNIEDLQRKVKELEDK